MRARTYTHYADADHILCLPHTNRGPGAREGDAYVCKLAHAAAFSVGPDEHVNKELHLGCVRVRAQCMHVSMSVCMCTHAPTQSLRLSLSNTHAHTHAHTHAYIKDLSTASTNSPPTRSVALLAAIIDHTKVRDLDLLHPHTNQ